MIRYPIRHLCRTLGLISDPIFWLKLRLSTQYMLVAPLILELRKDDASGLAQCIEQYKRLPPSVASYVHKMYVPRTSHLKYTQPFLLHPPKYQRQSTGLPRITLFLNFHQILHDKEWSFENLKQHALESCDPLMKKAATVVESNSSVAFDCIITGNCDFEVRKCLCED